MTNLNSNHPIYNSDHEVIEILFFKEILSLNHHFIPMMFLMSPEKFRFNSFDTSCILSPTLSHEGGKNSKFVENNAYQRRSSAISQSNFEVDISSGAGLACNTEQCLLSIFLEYTSIIMQNVRGRPGLKKPNGDENQQEQHKVNKQNINRDSYTQTKLCFTILAKILEDNFACTEIFNTKNKFIVNIYKTPMRHRHKQSLKLSFHDKSVNESFLVGTDGIEKVDSASSLEEEDKDLKGEDKEVNDKNVLEKQAKLSKNSPSKVRKNPNHGANSENTPVNQLFKDLILTIENKIK